MSTLIVERPRASLARVPQPDTVDGLVLAAALGSWDGLDQLTALRSFEMTDGAALPPDGLGPVGSHMSLRHVTIHLGDGIPGVKQIGKLTDLESLSVWCGSGCSALDQEWLASLTDLQELQLVTTDGRLMRRPLGQLAALRRLERLKLAGIYPVEGPELFASGFPTLRYLYIMVPDVRVGQAIAQLRPDIDLEGAVHEDSGPFAPEIAEIEGGFSVYLDLSERFGVEGNHEAMEVVEERLTRERPAWAAKLSFDPEADGVSVVAAQREALEQFLAWVGTTA